MEIVNRMAVHVSKDREQGHGVHDGRNNDR